jgi:hypothetical protein
MMSSSSWMIRGAAAVALFLDGAIGLGEEG